MLVAVFFIDMICTVHSVIVHMGCKDLFDVPNLRLLSITGSSFELGRRPIGTPALTQSSEGLSCVRVCAIRV